MLNLCVVGNAVQKEVKVGACACVCSIFTACCCLAAVIDIVKGTHQSKASQANCVVAVQAWRSMFPTCSDVRVWRVT